MRRRRSSRSAISLPAPSFPVLPWWGCSSATRLCAATCIPGRATDRGRRAGRADEGAADHGYFAAARFRHRRHRRGVDPREVRHRPRRLALARSEPSCSPLSYGKLDLHVLKEARARDPRHYQWSCSSLSADDVYQHLPDEWRAAHPVRDFHHGPVTDAAHLRHLFILLILRFHPRLDIRRSHLRADLRSAAACRRHRSDLVCSHGDRGHPDRAI